MQRIHFVASAKYQFIACASPEVILVIDSLAVKVLCDKHEERCETGGIPTLPKTIALSLPSGNGTLPLGQSFFVTTFRETTIMPRECFQKNKHLHTTSGRSNTRSFLEFANAGGKITDFENVAERLAT